MPWWCCHRVVVGGCGRAAGEVAGEYKAHPARAVTHTAEAFCTDSVGCGRALLVGCGRALLVGCGRAWVAGPDGRAGAPSCCTGAAWHRPPAGCGKVRLALLAGPGGRGVADARRPPVVVTCRA